MKGFYKKNVQVIVMQFMKVYLYLLLKYLQISMSLVLEKSRTRHFQTAQDTGGVFLIYIFLVLEKRLGFFYSLNISLLFLLLYLIISKTQ